jgi:hypothetical protein
VCVCVCACVYVCACVLLSGLEVACLLTYLCVWLPLGNRSIIKEFQPYLEWVDQLNRAIEYFTRNSHFKGSDKALKKLVRCGLFFLAYIPHDESHTGIGCAHERRRKSKRRLWWSAARSLGDCLDFEVDLST